MQMRHEYKHIISRADFMILCARLPAVMQPDPHAGPDGCYQIRSLYFDTATDRMLREKLDGLSRREKYRIRLYDGRDDFIRLEKKIKLGGLGTKISAMLSREETELILAGEFDFLLDRPENVLRELAVAMRCEGLRPKTLVDYKRRPFVYGPGNVRVTLDYDIRTGLYATNLFDASAPTMKAGNGEIILEVKYDDFLPDVIRDVVSLGGVMETAFSKYSACRQFDLRAL